MANKKTSRPRSHILEDESRNALRSIIPSEWVYRDKTSDYGIDCEIEIFSEDGKPTGLVFWIQIKATDSKKDSTIKGFSIQRSKIIQFNNYDIPVLVARYSNARKVFFIKWSEEVDVFNNHTANIRITFDDSNIIEDDSFKEIINYLKKVSIIKQGGIRFPLPVYIYNDSLTKSKTIPRLIISNLRNGFSKHPDLIENVIDSVSSLVTISLHKEHFKVSICNQGIAYQPFPFKDLRADNYPDLTKMLLSSISMCLFQVGKNEMCNNLIFQGYLFNTIKASKQVLIYLLPCLITGSYFEKVIPELIDIIHDDKEDNIIQLVTQSILLIEKTEYREERLLIIESFLREQITWAESNCHDMLIGVAYYNLANHYRFSSKYEQAVRFYITAKKHYKGYLKHSYFFHELGGVFHTLGKYRWSSNCYKKALDLGDSPFMTKALYADSLMYSGFYSKAKNIFDEYLAENTDNSHQNDEWYLKFNCLETLLENGYPSTQIRDSKKALELSEKGAYKKALESDLLFPLAWFNNGIDEEQKGNNIEAAISFILAGLLQWNDIESWVNATILTSLPEFHSSIIVNVVRSAYHYNKEIYIEELANKLSEIDNEFMSAVMNVVDEIIPKKNQDFKTIRVHFNDDSYETLNIPL